MVNRDHISDLLERMEQEDTAQRKAGKSREERWRSIPRISGKFLYQMIMLHQPRHIVEIGMSHGYSTVWMAMAAEQLGATIDSYEVSSWRYEQAQKNFSDAGLDHIISAHLVNPDFSDYPDHIDMVFIDAEKTDYIQNLKNLEDKLTDHAMILADNVISHANDLQGYLDYVRTSGTYYSMVIPIGKGIECSRKLKSGEFTELLQ